MNRKETSAILSILRTAYPRFYAGMSREEIENAINLWQMMFDEPSDVVALAVKEYINKDENGFPPCIGQIKKEIKKSSEPFYGGDYPAGSQGHVPLGQLEKEAVKRLLAEPVCLNRPMDHKQLNEGTENE